MIIITNNGKIKQIMLQKQPPIRYKIADIYDILSKLFRFWGNDRPPPLCCKKVPQTFLDFDLKLDTHPI